MSWFHTKARAKRFVCRVRGHDWQPTMYSTPQCRRCRTFKADPAMVAWASMLHQQLTDVSLAELGQLDYAGLRARGVLSDAAARVSKENNQ